METSARRVRTASWSLVGILLVPRLLSLYRRTRGETGSRSEKHALTVAAPWIAGAVILVLVPVVGYGPRWFPRRTSHGVPPPPPPPMQQPILPR